MIRFIQWPWALALVAVLPLLSLIAITRERRSRAKRLAQFGSREMLARLAPRTSIRGPLRTIRIVTACALLAFAFAGPRWGLSDTVVKRDGVDVVVAIDASLSMLAQDEAPSRLTRVKQVVRQLRALSPNDRFALLVFAGRSYILTPLTTDDGALSLYLDNLDPSIVGQAGSSIASPIRQAVNLLLLNKTEGDRAIVLLSDGEGFDDLEEVRAEGRRVAQAGIELITVGFGTLRGSTIPIRENGQTTTKRDDQGNIVITKYSPIALRTAAEAAEGVFIDARTTDKAEQIRRVLDRLKTSPRSIATGQDLSPQFQWFVGIAFVLLMIDTFSWLRTRLRRATITPAAGIETAVIAAILAMHAAACTSDRDPRNVERYNRGTTLLSRDSLQAAVPILDSAIQSTDPELHFRAAFNSGWASLVSGLSKDSASAAPPESADSNTALLDSALARYRTALIERPNDPDAKWNYELALRNENQSGGGGGGGAQNAGGGGGDEEQQDQRPVPRPQSRPQGGIGQPQAGAILDNAAREERDVQGRRQNRNVPQPPPTGKDW